jgi:hypothetical protein
MGESFDDGEVPIDDLRNDPTPVPTMAPKAEVATTPVMVAKPAPAPVQATSFVELDDPMPAASASADVDGADHHDVDDGDVVEQEAASDEDDDDTSSEEDEPWTCQLCDLPATESLVFTAKDGSQAQCCACDPSKHAAAFHSYLQKVAKDAPKSPMDVIVLFNPIPTP